MTDAERRYLTKIEDLSYRLTRAEMAVAQARVCLLHPSSSGNALAIAEIDRVLAMRLEIKEIEHA
jgi:hypothetical protein